MKIGKREKKALILGGIAVSLILLYLFYDWFIGYRRDLGLKGETMELQVSRLMGKISEKEEIDKRLSEAKATLRELEKGLLPGDKPAVAAAELQKILKTMASTSGVDIRSERILSPVDMKHYSAISVEVVFVSTTKKLRDLLYSIERSPILLVIPDMKIRVTNIRNPTDIQVNLTVKGLIRKAALPAKEISSI